MVQESEKCHVRLSKKFKIFTETATSHPGAASFDPPSHLFYQASSLSDISFKNHKKYATGLR